MPSLSFSVSSSHDLPLNIKLLKNTRTWRNNSKNFQPKVCTKEQDSSSFFFFSAASALPNLTRFWRHETEETRERPISWVCVGFDDELEQETPRTTVHPLSCPLPYTIRTTFLRKKKKDWFSFCLTEKCVTSINWPL